MNATAYAIFEIKKGQVTKDAQADFIHAKFRSWNFIHLENEFTDYNPKPNFALIRVDIETGNLFPWDTGKEVVRDIKAHLEAQPEKVVVKYL